jgi:hypothetical protein
MHREGQRRLEVWLPDTHPIFHVPHRQRSARVRELLDLAFRLDVHLQAIREAVEGIRAAVERGDCLSRTAPEPERGKKFLAAFEEWQ